MKKYEVTLYYCTNVTVTVAAKDEHDAVAYAILEASDTKYDETLLRGLQENGSPDVIEIEED